jgi:gliding motility-associated-like protein
MGNMSFSQSSCPNLGFDQNNFSNWTGYTGTYSNPAQSTGIVNGRHTIMTGGTDPNTCGGLSRVPPGASWSARLGDDGSGAEGERLTYSMPVTSLNAIFVYKYSAVLEDAGHPASDQPKLTVKVKDQSGNQIGGSCGIFDVYAGQSGQNFNNCAGVKWMNWSTAAIDLTSFIGQTIRIEFTTKDCNQGAHFGYAYIWATCMPLVQDAAFCAGQSALLQAPTGFQTYSWTTGQSTSSITVNNPVANSSYLVTLGSVGNQGSCAVDLTYNLAVTTPVANLSGTSVCVNTPNQFTDLSSTNNDVISAWNWNFGDGGTSTLQNPSYTYSSPGTYTVTLTSQTSNGCTATNTTQINIYAAPGADFSFNNACFYDPLTFTDQTAGATSSLAWDMGDGTTFSQSTVSYEYASEGQYNVQLIATSPQGCKDTTVQIVTAHPKPLANFSVSPVCQTTVSDFTDASSVLPLTNDVIQSWNYNFGDAQSSSQQDPSHTYANEGVYTVQLIATTNNGCKDTTQLDATVYPLPNAEFISNAVCEGLTNNLTDQSSVSNVFTANQITSYAWNFDGQGTSPVASPTFTFSGEGVYPCTLTITTDNGCVDSVTHDVSVYPLPISQFAVTAECEGISNVFTDQSSISNTNTSNTINSWSYQFGDGQSSSSADPSHEYTTEGVYDAVLTVTSNHGCQDTSHATVTVYPLPVADFNATAVCDGLSNVITDLSSVSNTNSTNAITSWNWELGDGAVSNTQNPTHQYPTDGAYDCILSVITDHNCQDTAHRTIYVYPLPVADFNVNAVCEYFANSFVNASSVQSNITGDQIVTYAWDYGDGNSSSVQNPGYVYASDGTYTATLEVTTNHGCSDDVTHPVTVHPKPDASFTGVDLSGCSPICPQITSTSTVTGSSVIDTYQWTYSDGNTANNESINRCFENFTGQTNYYGINLIVATNQGCKDTANANDYIQVYHIPIAEFDFSPYDADIVHSTVEFDNLSQYANSYLWNFDYFETSTMYEPTIEFPDTPGDYMTRLIAYTVEGCVDTAYGVVPIKDVLIYYVPNTFTPDNDDFNEVFMPVFYSGFDPFDYNLLIFNRWGEIVFESNDATVGWNGMYNNTLVQDGTFTWKITFKRSDSDKHQVAIGHVNVIR